MDSVMSEPRMSERVSRGLHWLAAGLLLVFGVPAFLLPVWASEQFPWAVGPFLAQTIGAWSVGTAAMAASAAWRRRPARTYPVLIYLGLFGLGQLLVVAAFADRLQTGHLLAWPYLGGMVALAVSGVAAVPALRAAPARVRAAAGDVPTWARLLAIAVGGFVLLLALGTLLAGPDGATAHGGIFPEPMSLFSIRAFSAFLFSIGIAILLVVPSPSMWPYRELALGGMYLVIPITLAALLNLSLFDFAGRPGHLLYLAAYVVVGLALAVALAVNKPGPEPDVGAAGAVR